MRPAGAHPDEQAPLPRLRSRGGPLNRPRQVHPPTEDEADGPADERAVRDGTRRRRRDPVTALVVLVDDAAPSGAAAALLEIAPGHTLLDRLLAQLATFDIRPSVVLTRSQWREAVAAALPSHVPVVGFADTAGALGSLAAHLDRAPGAVLIAHGNVLAHGGVLGDLVADSRLRTAVLTPDQPGPTPGAGHVNAALVRIDAADRATGAAAAGECSGSAAVSGSVDDAVELLVTAVRRRGVTMGAVEVGGYVCERPTTAEQTQAGAARLAAVDEHRVRLRRVARPDDGFYSTFVVRKISPRLTEQAVRHGWTPNSITLAALVIALAAAGCFATGERFGLILGAVLLQVSLVVDCVDGETARYTRTFSQLGAWLDATTDRVKEYAVYAALAVGSSRSGQPVWTWAAAALALQVFRNFVDFGFVATLAKRPPGRGRTMSGGSAPPSSGSGSRALGQGAISLSERTSGNSALKWAKRMVFLPIGERWLIISVFAAGSGARAVFAVLLVLGAVSAVYATAGRVLRALAVDPPVAGDAVLARGGELEAFLDVGPLSRALAPRLPAVPRDLALGAAGLAALITAAVATPEHRVITALGLLATLALAAPAWRDPPGGRFGWLIPGFVRALEYGLVVRVVVAVDEPALPAAFGALCAVAYHHYDTVYRWRYTRVGPEPAVFRYGLGWDGRLLALAVVLLLTDRLTWLFAIGGALLAVLFLAESATGWARWISAGAGRPAVTRSA